MAATNRFLRCTMAMRDRYANCLSTAIALIGHLTDQNPPRGGTRCVAPSSPGRSLQDALRASEPVSVAPRDPLRSTAKYRRRSPVSPLADKPNQASRMPDAL